VARLLERQHGSADLGNRADPVEELVWIPLTRQTHHQNAVRCWQRIVAVGGPRALLEMPEHELVRLIEDGGFARQKARWIKGSLAMLADRLDGLDLGLAAGWSDAEVERMLLRLPGIAIKSARCVMMYSLGRQVLPVDTHLRRLAERLGWVRPGLGERRIHDALAEVVLPELRYGLHVNAVWHGRTICRAIDPRCEACVLLTHCAEGLECTSGPSRTATLGRPPA